MIDEDGDRGSCDGPKTRVDGEKTCEKGKPWRTMMITKQNVARATLKLIFLADTGSMVQAEQKSGHWR